MEILNLFTSESVTEGHPDKMADQISDAILDEILKQDENARVACEVFITNKNIFIGGEITTKAKVNYEEIARNVIKEIGLIDESTGVSYKTYKIDVYINKQSPDINQGVDLKDGDLGAGDQGIMFGYATNETKDYMPFAIYYAHKLAKKLAEVRKNNNLPYLRPDGKTQISIEYNEDNTKIKRISGIVISTQHDENIDFKTLKKDIYEYVIKPIIPEKYIDENTDIFINPTGKFIIGGSIGDAGLTGRKIIVDTYGGSAAHGGGAFSGKDYTKVDRSAAYMARYLAKNIVASGICDKAQIQLAYVIGRKEPMSVNIQTINSKVDNNKIVETILNNFDLSPKGIVEKLELKKPQYLKTATYGHFGNSEYSWEKLNDVELFKSLLNK